MLRHERCGPIKWDKDKVVAALPGLQAKGLGLNTRAIQKSDLRLAAAIWGHFGTDDAAIRAAGGDPDAVRPASRPWDKCGKVRAPPAAFLFVRSRLVAVGCRPGFRLAFTFELDLRHVPVIDAGLLHGA
jgi:hypothetical protein